MNPFEMVVLVVAMAMATGIVIRRMELRQSLRRGSGEDEEKLRLRQEVRELRDRMKVLERIVTDSGVQTAAQIEALRDRDRIPEDEANG